MAFFSSLWFKWFSFHSLFFFFPCWLCALWPFSFFSACPFCVRFSLCTGSLGKYNYFLLDFAFAYGNLYALYSIRMSFSIFQLLLRSGGDHIVVCDRHRHRHCHHCTECLLFSPLGVCVLKWTMVCTRFCKICMQLNKIVRCIIKITEFTIQLLLILSYVNLHALLSCKIDCVCPLARSRARYCEPQNSSRFCCCCCCYPYPIYSFIHSFSLKSRFGFYRFSNGPAQLFQTFFVPHLIAMYR